MSQGHDQEHADLVRPVDEATALLAELEARARAVERAERELAERERDLAASSAAMARELRDAAQALREREQQFKAAGSAPGNFKSRRERLKRVRKALRDRAMKLQRYEAVLDDRAREADQVLAQRREVAKAAAVVQAREKKLASVQSRNKTLTASFFAVAAVGIIGVLSFAAADHIAPATYAVTAEIAADARGRELSADELDEWQRYAEGLLTDPGLLEIAAERMQKRGILSMGNPADLRVMLRDRLTSASPEPGRLTIELVGLGSGATSRTLDTYIIALVAQSNATKSQRAGGTGSRVAADVAVQGEPLEDQRLTYAAGFGGGSLVVSLLIGSAVYRRLRAQHKAFEQGVID